MHLEATSFHLDPIWWESESVTSERVTGGNRYSIESDRAGIKQINSRVPNLLHSSIIEKHPFRRFGVIGEGRVMFTRKTDHPHQMQLAPFGIFISDTVEKLKESKWKQV